jgi:hypothetical protein
MVISGANQIQSDQVLDELQSIVKKLKGTAQKVRPNSAEG